jgi:hypothetical protein
MEDGVDRKYYLGKSISVLVDRPIGSKDFGCVFPVNCGFIPINFYGKYVEMTTYILGVETPLHIYKGVAKAVIHRLDEDKDFLVVMPKEVEMTDQQIRQKVSFQEQNHKFEIYRCKTQQIEREK